MRYPSHIPQEASDVGPSGADVLALEHERLVMADTLAMAEAMAEAAQAAARREHLQLVARCARVVVAFRARGARLESAESLFVAAWNTLTTERLTDGAPLPTVEEHERLRDCARLVWNVAGLHQLPLVGTPHVPLASAYPILVGAAQRPVGQVA